MNIKHDIPLSSLTTMRLGGKAREVATFSTKQELEEIFAYITEKRLPFFVVGGGSNIIASRSEYDGVIVLSQMMGFEILDQTDTTTTIKIGAGENWDDTVARTVEMGLSGIEAMSAIPGTVGATPVQNVGAYGQEIADTFIELEAYDTESKMWSIIKKDECRFSYRNSIFKDPSKRRHIITSVTLGLNKSWMNPPFYDSLQKYLDAHNITEYSPANIRDAVMAIRAKKLPDPSVIANTGSFFKNPIVPASRLEQLLDQYPGIPHFPMHGDSEKIAAGWLIEQAGLKGYSAYGLRTYEDNALVVVNDSATSYEDLEAFKNDIIHKVEEKFGITLEQEPETL